MSTAFVIVSQLKRNPEKWSVKTCSSSSNQGGLLTLFSTLVCIKLLLYHCNVRIFQDCSGPVTFTYIILILFIVQHWIRFSYWCYVFSIFSVFVFSNCWKDLFVHRERMCVFTREFRLVNRRMRALIKCKHAPLRTHRINPEMWRPQWKCTSLNLSDKMIITRVSPAARSLTYCVTAILLSF